MGDFWNFLLFSISILFLPSGSNSARILCVFPTPAISHQSVFRAYTQELVKRGHELVIITPNPALPKNRPKDNVTEIDVSNTYETFNNFVKEIRAELKRGIILDFSSLSDENTQLFLKTSYAEDQLDHPEVKKLIEDKNQHFDLIVAEAMLNNYLLILSVIFKAPFIQMSSFYSPNERLETMGAVSRHPILYPHKIRDKFRNLTYWETLCQVYKEYRLSKFVWDLEQMENDALKERFGPLFSPIQELKNNVAMLFVNTHPIFDGNRPVPPNVVYLGAAHLLPVKKLPTDLKAYLDNSTKGAVYVSFGSLVRTSYMDQELLDTFLDAFKSLPYNILWKFDDDTLPSKPKNLKIQKWLPQRDLLMHPNIKAFVTQGGLQSTDEAIDAGVPLVGIPMLADQWYNVNKYVEFGIGVQLDGLTFTADQLEKGIKTVIEDDSYRRNILRLRSVVYDRPERPLERAIWWTEHVLRHGGARHLHPPGANITWSQFLMLDIVIPIIVTTIILLIFAIIICCYVLHRIKMIFRGKDDDKLKFN